MQYKARNWQTKESITGSWADMDGLDNRLWRIKEVSDAPKSHRQDSTATYKAIEILPNGMIGRIKIQGTGYRQHNFINAVIANMNLTSFAPYPETSEYGKSL